MLCLFLINMLHNTYSLLDEDRYSKEEFKSSWHPILGFYGDLMDRVKPLKTPKNENKLFYPSGYGIMGRPNYPFQYIREYYGYPYYGEMLYQPNGWYTGASSDYFIRKDKNNL